MRSPSHKLSTYIAALAPLLLEKRNGAGFPVADVSNDSRRVCADSIFVAIKGTASDGHGYIRQAIANGAKCIICTTMPEELSGEINYLLVSDAYHAYAICCRILFGYPDRALKLIAITGTNGKTTSAYIFEHLLAATGKGCALISTVEYRTGTTIKTAERTTPEAKELFALLAEMRENKMTYVVMELSSHALDQYRLGDAQVAAAIFTNLSGDHLDYHKSMSAYFAAKETLFSYYLAPDGVAVINGDDAAGRELAKRCAATRKTITFGEKRPADMAIRITALDGAHSSFVLSAGKFSYEFDTNLVGRHNVFNLTGALIAAHESAHIPYPELSRSLSSDIRVPGRLEKISSPLGVDFYIDYAHTDDALGNVLAILRTLARQRLILLFGCGGDRDKSKRPRMAQAAQEQADHIIVTSDNPRSEEPSAIMEEICRGFDGRCPYEKIGDRAAAIEHAYRIAAPGDIVLIAGKGHEDYQEISGKKVRFSDREEVEKLISGK